MQDQGLPYDAGDPAVGRERGGEPVQQQAGHAFQPFAVFYKVSELSGAAAQQGAAGLARVRAAGGRGFHDEVSIIPARRAR